MRIALRRSPVAPSSRGPLAALLLGALLSCATARPTAAPVGEAELVESWPEETRLDRPDLRDARDVWPALFAGAQKQIDLAWFYLSDQAGSALGPCVAALEAAAARGVRLRVLADEKFYKEYPETLERLARSKNAEVRRIDWRRGAGGGVLHAKYFVIDGGEAFLGSQNFDWRALQHIVELGVRFRAPRAVAALQQVFEADWALAAGAGRPQVDGPSATVAAAAAEAKAPGAAPLAGAPAEPLSDRLPDGTLLTLLTSPEKLAQGRWDLPELVKLIDGARRTVRVELLTYGVHSRDGSSFTQLEDALRRAAERGVEVTLLLSDWALRKGSVEHLAELQQFGAALVARGMPGLQVRIITIPPHSSGPIPFARVAHAKYLVVDGERAWVGTSNWEGDYFFQSRNVGVRLEGGPLPARVERYFLEALASGYVKPL